MAFTDHHDVFVGSTDDRDLFFVINHPFRAVPRIMARSGFSPFERGDRTLYLLPPGTPAGIARDAADAALTALLAETMDIADLSPTSWAKPGSRGTEPDVCFDLSTPHVTATTHSDTSREALPYYGFRPDGTHYALPDEMSELTKVSAVLRAGIHLHTLGTGLRITLGIPTRDSLALTPRPTQSPTPKPARPAHPPEAKRRTR